MKTIYRRRPKGMAADETTDKPAELDVPAPTVDAPTVMAVAVAAAKEAVANTGASHSEMKITVADLDKAAKVYEAALEQMVLNPDPEKAGQMTDLMDALDALDHIQRELTGDTSDDADDDSDDDDSGNK